MADERSEIQFAAMLRIRNEGRWIAEVLEALFPLCERLFVLDDHSTDDTAAICKSYAPNVRTYTSPFSGLNEARDKNWLFDQVMLETKPEWIICVDGDEVLAPGSAEAIKQHVIAEPSHAYSLKIVFLWNDRATARVDRIYGDFWRPSLFKPFHPDPNTPDHQKILGELRWMSTPFGRRQNGDEPNLHCSSVPQRFLHGHQRCPAQLLHYGYMDRADRVRKLDYYTGIDWLNRAEDSYRHMTQGDGVTLDELPTTKRLIAEGKLSPADADFMINTPPEAYLLHAGPIRLAAL